MFDVNLVHIHAVEETLRYIDEHGEDATYEGVIDHLSWYWMDHSKPMKHMPEEWVLIWIKNLMGVENEIRASCFY